MGLPVSEDEISRITDKVIEEMNDWAVRPLDEVYAAIFIDAIVVEAAQRPGPTGRSTPRSGSPSAGNATSSGCGRRGR